MVEAVGWWSAGIEVSAVLWQGAVYCCPLDCPAGFCCPLDPLARLRLPRLDYPSSVVQDPPPRWLRVLTADCSRLLTKPRRPSGRSGAPAPPTAHRRGFINFQRLQAATDAARRCVTVHCAGWARRRCTASPRRFAPAEHPALSLPNALTHIVLCGFALARRNARRWVVGSTYLLAPPRPRPVSPCRAPTPPRV